MLAAANSPRWAWFPTVLLALLAAFSGCGSHDWSIALPGGYWLGSTAGGVVSIGAKNGSLEYDDGLTVSSYAYDDQFILVQFAPANSPAASLLKDSAAPRFMAVDVHAKQIHRFATDAEMRAALPPAAALLPWQRATSPATIPTWGRVGGIVFIATAVVLALAWAALRIRR